jgi:uncharacterized protein (TIGR00251 family)
MQRSCAIEIRLKPNAKQNAIDIGDDGILHIRVNAPPIEGRANNALIELLSESLDIPKSCLSIKRGETSKNKVIAVIGMTKEEAIKKALRGKIRR